MPGGAEALAIFHQLLYDEWSVGGLRRPLARIKLDEQKLFWFAGVASRAGGVPGRNAEALRRGVLEACGGLGGGAARVWRHA